MALAKPVRILRDHLALVLTVASLVVWSSLYLLFGPTHPYGDLSNGNYTDHFSHMNTARLFTHAGPAIWTGPMQDSAIPLTPEQRAALPADLTPEGGQEYPVFTVPGWPADKPFVSSWSTYPRFHPPGDMVLTAPVAVLYSFTDLSFSDANRLLILTFLALAHISIYVLLKFWHPFDGMRPVGFLVLFIVYLELVHWSLEGFYEGVIIAPLVVSANFLARRKGLQAIAMFTLAAVLHFRAYFFAPLAIYGAFLVVRDRQWRTWTRREIDLAGVTVALAVISLGVFSRISPWLREMNSDNPVGVTVADPDIAAIAVLLLVAAIVAAVFVYTRSWLDLVLIGWLTTTSLLLQQTWWWDILSILAWLAMPIAASAAARPSAVNRLALIRDARIVAVVFVGSFVFKNTSMLNPSWLQLFF